MRRTAFNKALVILMTFVLVFSSNSTVLTPVIAYAVEAVQQQDESTGDAFESDATQDNSVDTGSESSESVSSSTQSEVGDVAESDATLGQDEDAVSSDDEAVAGGVETSGAQSREACNITNNASLLSLSLDSLSYDASNEDGSSVVNASLAAIDEDNSGVSSISASEIDLTHAGNFTLVYKAELSEGWLAGDRIAVSVPKTAFDIDTDRLSEWVELQSGVASAELTETKSSDELGATDVYTVTYTLADDATGTPKTLELELPFDFADDAITAEGAEVTLTLATAEGGSAKTAVIKLPKAPSEEDEGVTLLADSTTITTNSTTRITLTKQWIDNNNSARKVAEVAAQALKLQVSINGGGYSNLTDAYAKLIGLSGVPKPIYSTATSIGYTTFDYGNLPTSITKDGQEITIAWKVVEDEAAAKELGYKPVMAENGSITNYELMDFTVNVKNLTGMDSDDYNKSSYTVWKLKEGGDPTKAESWESVATIDKGKGLSQTEEQQGSNIYTLTAEDLPRYYDDNTEITYSITSNNECPSSEDVSKDPTKYNYDWFAPTYENSESANHGTEVDRAYEGGTIVLTRTSATTMTVTKKWLDGDGNERPAYDASNREYQLWLWRYINDGTKTYKDAAQVVDGNGYPVGANLPNNGTSTFVDGEIIFSYRHEAGNTDATQYLPKYDAEGYEYVYLAREDFVDSRYEQVYGSVANGTVYDVGAAGNKLQRTDGTSRSDTADESIYNGGTITNRLKGTVSVEATKTWEAAAHQSYLSSYSVEMKLQSRRKGTTSWSDTGITQTINGFSPTVTSQSVSASEPQYDAQGYELEYQWTEGSITYEKDGETQTATSESDSKFTTGYNTTEQGKSTSVDDRLNNDWYESTLTTDESGNVTITNKLKGYEDYLLRKIWKGTDGEVLSEAPAGATITVRLYRDGNPYTVKQDDDIEAYTKEITLSASDVSVNGGTWDYYFKDLPKYDDEGREYTYSVVELAASDATGKKYAPTYSTSDIERCTQIVNGPGVGQRIRIEKKWLDDSDSAHREQANLKITYQLKDGTQREDTIALTDSTDWWTYYYFGEDGKAENVDLATVQIEEVSIGAEGDIHTVADGRVKGCNHTYVVSPATKNSVGGDTCYVISNRRIDTVNIAVTKTWNDGDNIAGRPEGATLTLTSDTVRAKVSESSVTVTSDEGNGTQTYEIKSGGITTESGVTKVVANDAAATSTQTVATTDNTYYFCNLPKYDMEGRVIHYDVHESWSDGSTGKTDGDYIISEGAISYVTDEFAGDSQTQTITNTRSDATTVNIYKTWKDAYQYNQGNRPDITLTLWQTQYDEQGSLTYVKYNGDGFKNYKWNPKDESSEKKAYELVANFGTLPEYDSAGRKIDYYFEESIPAGAVTNFDYTETTYKYFDENGTAHAATTDNGWLVEHEGHMLLKAEGTFVNAIAKGVTIQGIKYWQNVPSGFPVEQMPNITVDVYQASENSDSEPIWVASTASLNRANTNRWTFTLQYYGSNQSAAGEGDTDTRTALPKYDEDGYLYDYTVKENIKSTGIKDDDWKVVYNSSESGFSISNIYQVNDENNTASLKITKAWDRTVSGTGKDVYPAPTFEIHQVYSYIDANGGTQNVDTLFTTAKGSTDGSQTSEVTVSGLPVVSPDGTTKYKYYVAEQAINGYTTTDNDTEGTSVENAVELTAGETKELKKGASYDFSNVYVPGKLTINGTKVWNDGSAAASIRPSEVTLTLTRHAAAQSGANNAIGEETLSVEPMWTKTGDTWTFAYENLDKWAPNGTAWIYEVKESSVDGYKTTYSSTALKGSADASEVELTITNSYNKSATFNKTWVDSNNKYGTRPTQLSIKLQAALVSSEGSVPGATSTDWKDVTDTATFGTGLSEYLCKQVSGNTSTGTITTGTFPYTVDVLPTKAKIGGTDTYLAYRLVEVTETSGDVVNPKGKVTADSGESVIKSYTSQTGATTYANNTYATTFTNTLETTSLTINKIWGDNQNYWDQRGTLSFTLQYKDGDNWEEYSPKTEFSIAPGNLSATNPNLWTKTISDLPKVDAAGATYQWRVLETGYRRYSPAVVDGTKGAGTSEQTTSGCASAVTNTLNTSTFKLVKYGEDDTQNVLKNVSFKVTKDNKELFIWSTNAEGKASGTGDAISKGGVTVAEDGTIKGLPVGTYTFTEQYQSGFNAAYKQQLVFTVTVDNAGTVTVVTRTSAEGTGSVSWDSTQATISATDSLAKANFTINKVLEQDDGTTSALSDVTFQLYKYSEITQSYEAVEEAAQTTDVSGQAVFSDLLVGKYFVVETQVPDTVYYDYKTGYFFEVTNADGGTVVADTTTKGVHYQALVTSVYEDVELANGNLKVSKNAATITNVAMGGKIRFTKLDSTSNSPLSNAKFALYHKGYGADSFTPYQENGVDVVITDADGDGVYQKSGLAFGEYKLVEKIVPTGYTINKLEGEELEGCVATFTVKVDDNGKVLNLGNIYNTRILGTLNLTKTGDDGKLQSGVEFELQKNNGTADEPNWIAVASDANPEGIYTTGEDGTLKIENLEWGTYRIRETKPASGYVGGKNAEGSKFEIAATSTTVELKLTNKMSDITIKKTDSEGAALDGATFTLKNAAGETVTSWTTDKTGTKELKGLLNQGETYALTETRRAGYYALDGDIKFTVGTDGKVTLDENANGAATLDESGVVVSIANKLIQKDFEFTKAKFINETCADKTLSGGLDSEASEVIAGAMFELSLIKAADSDATFKTQTATSDAKGNVVFTGLIEGTYKLKETVAPEGVELFPESTLELTNEGKFVISNEYQTYEVDERGLKLTDEIERANLSFTKVSDVDATTPIAGATYQLYRMGAVSDSGLSVLANLLGGSSEGTLVAEATSDESGKVSFEGLLPEYTYRLHEKEAPAGSLRSAKDVVVSFQKDATTGEYKLVLDDDGESDVDGKAYYTAQLDEDGNLVWYEPQTEYNFVKLTAEGETLAGAKLQVEDKDGNAIDSWTSTNEPYAIVGKLAVGETYRLVETEAPEGYELADAVEFVVENKSSKDIDEDSALPGRQHTVTIVMVDEQTPEEPKDPENPASPESPATPASPSNSGQSKKTIPQTGDTTNSAPAIVMGVAGVILLVVGIVLFNRNK